MVKLTNLRLARLENGKCQWDVSQETGIPQSILSLYERNLKAPTKEHKEILARLFCRTEEDLFSGRKGC